MTDERLKELVKETVEWANDLSETWSGTTTGHIIENQKKHVESLMKSKDFNLASIAVLELAQTCDYAEKV